MANCHKCGKGKIKKRKNREPKCKHCGYLRENKMTEQELTIHVLKYQLKVLLTNIKSIDLSLVCNDELKKMMERDIERTEILLSKVEQQLTITKKE